ncbi:MAG: DUF4270 family protein [Chitinophagaceae bacterium]|nr:DUF4270 family protein [Chitinophagaceae bacterium]
MKLMSLLYATGIVILAVIFNVRCTKINPTDIGTDLLPTVDNVHTFDTVLRVYTANYLFDDSTRMPYYDNHALGLIEDDPEFGKTDARIYMSLVPNSTNKNPFISSDSIIGIDSAFLNLSYAGAVFGDSNSVQKFTVYEISDPQFLDTFNRVVVRPDFTTTGTPIGGGQVTLNTIDDAKTIVVKRDTQTVSNVLRIPVDPALGLRFAAYDTGTVYPASRRDSAFQKVFNGIAVKVDETSPSKSAITYYDLENENTKLTFYFRVKNNGVIDTLATDFVFAKVLTLGGKAYSVSANTINRTPAHNYANLDLSTPVTDPEKIYIQSTPGSYAILTIPGLKGLDNRLIHRAELSMYRDNDAAGNDIYLGPDLLYLNLIDSANNNRSLTIRDDFVYNSSTASYDYQTFGGFIKNDKYFFNLTRYVQNIVTNKDTIFSFRLYAPKATLDYYVYPKEYGNVPYELESIGVNPNIAKGRVVLNGGGDPALKPKAMVLRIIYSKI